MTFSDIKKKEGRISGLVAIERALPDNIRSKIKKFLILFVPFIMLGLFIFEEQSIVSPNLLYGLMFLIGAAWLKIFMLDCFYYSHYFLGAKFTIPEWGVTKYNHGIPYEVLEIVSQTQVGDITRGFLESLAGRDIFDHIKISKEKISSFLDGDRKKVYTSSVTFLEPISLSSYVSAILGADKFFVDFLAANGVTPENFLSATVLVSDIYERRKETYRWWGRDSLSRIKSGRKV